MRRRKIQRLRLHLKLEEILHSTCRAPVLLVGVDLVKTEGGILKLVQYFKGFEFRSPSRVWHGRIKVHHCDNKNHYYCYLYTKIC